MGELHLHDLGEFINGYDTKVFIETGMGIGTGTRHALRYPFEKLHTIEITQELIMKANLHDNRLQIHHGYSTVELPKILKTISIAQPILFWLDAHFPGADFQLGSYDRSDITEEQRLPLEKEIDIINWMRPNNKDVLIIDDLMLLEDGDYELGPLREDLVKYRKNGIEFITKSFPNHVVKKDFRHQGFLILTPER